MASSAVFTHNDLDGLTCALLARVALPRADVYFCDYDGLPGLLSRKAERYDTIWLTDLSLSDEAVFGTLRESGAEVYWFDHHVSSIEQPWMAECRIDRTGDLCAADVVRAYVEEQGHALPIPLQTLSDWAHDQDLWIRDIPEAERFNDILGTMSVQKLFDLLEADLGRVYQPTEAMECAAERTRQARAWSLKLAEATSAWSTLPSGHRLRACCCWGSTSEVGDALGADDVLVIMCDLRNLDRGQPKLSFRTQSETIAANRIAEAMGGGGHPKASGAPLGFDALIALSHELLSRVSQAVDQETDP